MCLKFNGIFIINIISSKLGGVDGITSVAGCAGLHCGVARAQGTPLPIFLFEPEGPRLLFFVRLDVVINHAEEPHDAPHTYVTIPTANK